MKSARAGVGRRGRRKVKDNTKSRLRAAAHRGGRSGGPAGRAGMGDSRPRGRAARGRRRASRSRCARSQPRRNRPSARAGGRGGRCRRRAGCPKKKTGRAGRRGARRPAGRCPESKASTLASQLRFPGSPCAASQSQRDSWAVAPVGATSPGPRIAWACESPRNVTRGANAASARASAGANARTTAASVATRDAAGAAGAGASSSPVGAGGVSMSRRFAPRRQTPPLGAARACPASQHCVAQA